MSWNINTEFFFCSSKRRFWKLSYS